MPVFTVKTRKDGPVAVSIITAATREAAIVRLLQTAVSGEEFDVYDVNTYGYAVAGVTGPTGATGPAFYVKHRKTGSTITADVTAATREAAVAQTAQLAGAGEEASIMGVQEVPAWAVSAFPSWVPTNAKIHIDLVGGTPQGRAWVAGTGEVAVTTLLGSDPNTAGGYASSAYDPARLGLRGYQGGTGTARVVAFIGSARTKILDGCTITFQTYNQYKASPVNYTNMFEQLSAAGDVTVAVEAYIARAGVANTGKIAGDSYHGALALSILNVMNLPAVGTDTVNKWAITLTSTRGEFTANGYITPVAANITNEFTPEFPLVCALITAGDTLQFLQSITIYDSLPSTAGLSALSAL